MRQEAKINTIVCRRATPQLQSHTSPAPTPDLQLHRSKQQNTPGTQNPSLTPADFLLMAAEQTTPAASPGAEDL